MHGLSSFPAFSEASSRPCVLVLSYLHLEDFHQVISEQVLADMTRKQDQSQVQLAKDTEKCMCLYTCSCTYKTHTHAHTYTKDVVVQNKTHFPGIVLENICCLQSHPYLLFYYMTCEKWIIYSAVCYVVT